VPETSRYILLPPAGSEPLRDGPGGRLADGEPNMALLGKPMERLGSNAKGFRAIVIKDEDFKPIDAWLCKLIHYWANPL
jgi:hypothetical protein